jgi:uncharacterized protein YbaR (Trm112 family)
MHVELIDRLRCPNPHEDSWLVATATRAVDRHILDGALGCPVCGAEYAIREGEVWFDRSEPETPAGPSRSGEEAALRLAAMLDLDERGGLYVLQGAWTGSAPAMAGSFPDARFVFVATPDGPGASAVLRGTGDAIPLAAGGTRGVALDRAVPALVEAAVRALVAGGRLVAPAASAVPEAITVLARDAAWWVGERASRPVFSAPVTPRRAAPRTGRR